MESLAEAIKNLREENKTPLRKLAAFMDIDQAVLSKYEHGTRVPKREHIFQIATYFKVDEKSLLIKWLAKKVWDEVETEDLAFDALQLVDKQLKFKKTSEKDAPVAVMDYLKLGEADEAESIFIGDKLPSYVEFAAYLFKTVTGKKFDEKLINTQNGFIGEGPQHELYLFYKPNREWLKNNALTLNMIKELPEYKGKSRMVFASLKYVNDQTCKAHHVEFGKIPY